MTTSTAHVVYRLWAGEECVYVGVSKDLPKRLYQHKRSQPWWDDVTDVTTEPYPDFRSALDAERALIVEIRPQYNRQWNPDHDPTVLERIAFREFVESVTPKAESA